MKGSTVLLLIVLLLSFGCFYNTYKMSEDLVEIRVENARILHKLDSLQRIRNSSSIPNTSSTKGKTTSLTTSKPKSSSNIAVPKTSTESSKTAASAKPSASARITVDVSYKIEDRYIYESTIKKPAVIGNETGIVAVDVLVDHGGTVKKTTINSATTITDESVLEACRKAALQARFNVDFDARDRQPGVMIYKFVKR